MTWLLLGLPALALALAFAWGWVNDSDAAWFFCFVAGLVAFVMLIVVGSITLAKTIDRNTCRNYADATERPTRFVIYNYVTWDCLTPATDGRWIPTDQLRDISP